MSFGDDRGPISNFVGATVRQFDQVLSPAFDKGPKAPKPSLASSPADSPAPASPAASADTPGRHKSLLGQ